MMDTNLGILILTVFSVIIVNLLYYAFYDYKINRGLKTKRKMKLLARNPFLLASTILILSISLVSVVIWNAFFINRPVHLPYPESGYSVYAYEDIHSSNHVFIYKQYIDEREDIPGFELIDIGNTGDFHYLVYLSEEDDERMNFIIFIDYSKDISEIFRGHFTVQIETSKGFEGYPITFTNRKSMLVVGDTIVYAKFRITFELEVFNTSTSSYEELDYYQKDIVINP